MINKKGFTLMEVLVYIMLLVVVLTSVTKINASILNSKTRVEISTELTYNSRLIYEKLKQSIHKASGLDASSSLGVDPSTLVLNMPSGGSDITFDTYNKNISINGKSQTIQKLRMTVGSGSSIYITSDKVTLDSFEITDMTQGSEAENIKIQYQLSHVNPDSDDLWDKSVTIRSTFSMRSL